MTITKEIIEQKNNEKIIERQNLLARKNIPYLNKFNAFHNEMEESIIKAIYYSKTGLYIQDLQMMFAYSLSQSNNNLKHIIKNLVEEGYLFSVKTIYGNILGLTKEGQRQVKKIPEESQTIISDMTIDSDTKTTRNKIVSSYLAHFVFQKMNEEVLYRFLCTDVKKRNLYILEKYIQDFTFRDFLNKDFEERKKELEQIEFTKDRFDFFLTISKYTPAASQEYAHFYMNKFEADALKKTLPNYHEYILFLKHECLRNANEKTFYILYEFVKDKNPYRELEILENFHSTMKKMGSDEVIRIWLSNYQNDLVKKMWDLEESNQYLGWLNTKKSAFLCTKASKDKTDKDYEAILTNIDKIEETISKIQNHKSVLEPDFYFRDVSSYDDDGSIIYAKEKVYTIKRLEQNNIFLHEDGKDLIVYIVQNSESFDMVSLHKKISMAYLLLKRIFPLRIPIFKILTISEETRDYIVSIMPKLARRMMCDLDTAFIGNLLMESSEVIPVSDFRLQEKYRFIGELFQKIHNKGDKNNE